MISLHDVSKIHRRGETSIAALRGVTAEIEPGSFCFILGPSGSGKSTLLYLLGAMDEPTGGSITVAGTNLGRMSRRERDRYRREDVGFIFQNFNLLGNVSAIDNVLVPYVPTGQAKSFRPEAERLLGEVGLGERLHHRPSHLSGGEQQRVAIARALLKNPRLILADEPTGELDSQTGVEIFSHLRRMHAERSSTVVVVTHDASHLREGDHLLRIRDGLLESQEVFGEAGLSSVS